MMPFRFLQLNFKEIKPRYFGLLVQDGIRVLFPSTKPTFVKSIYPSTASSWLSLATVSLIRCLGIYSNQQNSSKNTDHSFFRWNKVIIAATWLVPLIGGLCIYYPDASWKAKEHTGKQYEQCKKSIECKVSSKHAFFS